MTENEKILHQKQLPDFDQYYKHNDYIQNFELAAAMDLTQHRIFDTLMSCIQTLKYHEHQYIYENGKGGKTVKLNLDFFMRRYLKSQNIKSIKKSELRMAVKSLAQIIIIKDTEDGIRARPVFQEVFANTSRNLLEIELSKYFSYDSLAPGKETKSPGYTKLLSSNQYALKSIYARIFYQYFLSKLAFKNEIEIEMEMEKLYKMLGIVDEEGKFLKGKKGYAVTSQFKRRCITESIEIINLHTELLINVNDVKSGRKVIGFIFNAKKKNESIDKNIKQLNIDKNTFKTKDDFVKHMKIYYKGNRITNSVPDCPIDDYLVLDNKGMLCFENSMNGIYRYSNDNTKDSKFAKKIWTWLYNNIDRVNNFTQLSKLEILNDKYSNYKIDVNNQIFACEKIYKDNEFWLIECIHDQQDVTLKIPLSKDIEYYLENIGV